MTRWETVGEKVGKQDVQSLESRTHPFFFSGETIFEDKPKENARPCHARFLQAQRLVTSPDSPDFCCSAHPIFFVHCPICFFHLSPISRICHLQLGTISSELRTHLFSKCPKYFPHKFSHVLKTLSSHRARSPA